jgi:spermidine dehydrogenase
MASLKPPGGSGLVEMPITRRDFCNAALVGCGAMLLAGCGSPSDDAKAGIADAGADGGPAAEWNGPSGVGEYRGSNGTTWQTMEAGHRIREAAYDNVNSLEDGGERYDLVVVGGGFTGLGALHAFHKERPRGTCLLLDNQEIFGGYAKANEFMVDGHRIAGAQASLNFLLPKSREDRGGEIWADLGLPTELQFADREDGSHSIDFAASTSGPLYLGEQSATTGYFFGHQGWVKDIWSDDLRRAPWPEATKQALLAMRERKRLGPLEGDEAARLDRMTFAEFATRELKATPEALQYITQGMCITGPQISAYGARALPGLERYLEGSERAEVANRFVSFPSGNSVIARSLVRAAVPKAFARGSAAEGFGKLNPAALDSPGSPCRIRSRATVVKVTNQTNGTVEVIYERDARLHRVTASGVVLGIGAWVAKRIVTDLPEEHRAALSRYLYSPMLMVSVALSNWRFLDKLGFSAARWFDGPGFYCNIRKPMRGNGVRAAPFHPDKPIVLTLYAPFPRPELPLEAQGPDGRAELFAKSYAEYESEIVTQLEYMFRAGGFQAKRDIAGIVLNRWGHAFVTPPPGFFFAPAGQTAPVDIMKHPVGRIALGQSGLEDWSGAVMAGRRAVEQLLEAV